MRWLQSANLTVKLSKCIFGANECNYFGHCLGGGGIHPEQSKVQGILDMAVPTTNKEVRSFLGMLG